MKKFLFAILCLSFVLCLWACTPAAAPTTTAGAVPVSIQVSGAKASFAIGEAFSSEGLQVTVTYDNGNTETLKAEAYTVDSSAFDASKAGTYTIIVKLSGTEISASYTVTVQELQIVDIALITPKTEFCIPESFDSEDLVVNALMSDGSQKALSRKKYTIDASSFDGMKAGTYTIAVKLNDTEIVKEYTVQVQPAKRLKVLMIGNSFSDDTIEYAYQIAQSMGIEEIVLGNLYIGGCKLSTHWSNAANNSAAYEYRRYINGAWHTTSGTQLSFALADEDWDIVTLQQNSGTSGQPATHSDLDKLMQYIRDNTTNPDIRIAWNMTWAYQQNSNHADFPIYNRDQMTMYNAIVSTVKSEIETRGFDAIIPNGTSIQNARTSFLGDTLTRDGYHLSYDMGRYIAGLTLVSTLTGIDASEATWAPSSMMKGYADVCKESAKNAIAKWDAITPSQLLTAPTPETEGLSARDYDYVGWAYYNIDSGSPAKLFTTDNIMCPKLVATQKFTKEELPVGTIIYIAPGWQYRPEFWTDETTPRKPRHPQVSTTYITVTEEWWGTGSICAFNISKIGQPKIEGQFELTPEIFKIYVPEGTYTPADNTFYQADSELLQQQGIDMRKMQLLDYTIITGYYNSQNNNSVNNNNLMLEANNTAFHTQFVSTQLFTKEMLPAGTVIILDEGWQYRPDAWTENGKPDPRPPLVFDNILIIDESWWEGFTVRGLIIKALDSHPLDQNPYEAKLHVRIYVPIAEETE